MTRGAGRVGPKVQVREFLLEKLRKRVLLNARYSQRAFARDLGLSPSQLAEVLKGRTGLSLSSAARIARNLELCEGERGRFLDLVECAYGRSPARRTMAALRFEMSERKPAVGTLELDVFALMGQWIHLALLECLKIKSVRGDPRSLAKFLAVTPAETADALGRLARFGFVTKRGECYERADPGTFATPNDIPSAAIRQFHVQILERALSAVKTLPPDARENQALVLQMKTTDLPALKQEIRAFVQNVDAVFAQTPSPDAVMCVAVQLFPLATGKD